MNPEHTDIAHWFSIEVQVHREALRNWLRGRFPAVADPDDIVEEALTRVWRAREGGVVASPRALLFTTAHHLAVDEVRRRRVASIEPVTEVADLSVYEEGPTPVDTAAHNQELELLTQAIQALPDRCRQVLTLRKIYGLSQKEISTRLGIAEHTVEAQVANGMRRCAEFLARLGLP